MHNVDGLEALQQIKSNDYFSKIKVIIHYTSKNEKHIREAYKYGADYDLIKPRKFEDYQNKIKQLLMNRQQSSGLI